MKTSSFILSSLGLCLSGLMLANLTHAQTPQPNNNGNGDNTNVTNSYPANERRVFIASCAPDRGTTWQVVCGCTFDKIRANIPYSQYQEIARKLNSGEDLPQNILNFINECIDNPNP
ncbi:MAG: hypothetical protein AB4290_23120 [Spirulina sp.]